MKKLFISFTVFLLLLTATGCKSSKKTVDPIDDNYRVVYQIFVGSFSDSNNDGIGDLQGIINRLDYLNDGDINSGKSLGVQLLWLSPIFRSPSYHKYDVSDYYSIDSDFGTEEDLKELISKCHERNVKVILDVAINHTSTSHLWFLNFLAAHQSKNTASEYYDYYTCVTRDTMVSGRHYKQIPGTEEFYECNFSDDMPELNYDSEKVREEVLDIARYYLDLGIDGFRFDAVKYVYYGDTSSSVDFWKWYVEQIREISPDAYIVGECWSADSEIYQYTAALNCFAFSTSQAEGTIAAAAKGGNVNVFTSSTARALKNLQNSREDAMFTPFISNHDMDRSAGYLMMANKWNYMAANLYLLCSGSPVIYYGEEIGMKGTRGTANTDANRRLAMLWGDGDTVEDPEGATYDREKQTNGTAKEQMEKSDSLYNYYARLIALRNKYPAIARGSYSALAFSDTFVGGFSIEYEGETIYLIHNTTSSEKSVDLSKVTSASEILDYIGQGEASLENGILTISAQTSVILH